MFFWFAGLSFLLVLVVFSSPALDYRLVMLGAAVPAGEIVFGGAGPAHSIVTPIVVLAVVMGATTGRRLLRRQLLGFPIGLFMHLVLDGSWSTSTLFWWPLLGTDVDGSEAVEFGRSFGSLALMEVIGLMALGFLVRRFDLLGEGRDRFVSTGQVARALMG